MITCHRKKKEKLVGRKGWKQFHTHVIASGSREEQNFFSRDACTKISLEADTEVERGLEWNKEFTMVRTSLLRVPPSLPHAEVNSK